MRFLRRERCPQRSEKAPEIIGNIVGENFVRPPENEQIHDKSVGFGVPDEPIRLRRIVIHSN